MKKKKSTLTLVCGLILTAFAFSSCTPITPQTRIETHKPLYERLTKKEKESVDKGEIKEGMSKDAVFLAWGKPNRETDIYKNSQLLTRWDYTQLRPIYQNNIYGGVNYGRSFYHPHRYYRHGYHGRRGYGRRGYYGHRGYGWGNNIGIGTSIRYVPEITASVHFKNEKVKSWKMER